jgi:peptidoglycan hydrolase-like protein with peptidoglycan-binding domain
MPPRGRRLVGVWIVAGIAILVTGGGIGWAASTVLMPPKEALKSSAYTYVDVVEGQVGSSVSLNAVAEWTSVPIGSNNAIGTVTTVNVAPGQEVGQGATLYTVNLRPVVVAKGGVPVFESLARGSKGPDVAQLQRMLSALGYFREPDNGEFGSATRVAVKAWQKSLGITADGQVQPGDLIFVPTLPTRVTLDPKVIKRGSLVTGGEEILSGLSAVPTFTIPTDEAQSALLPNGTRVEITNAHKIWDSIVTSQTQGTNGVVTVHLGGKDTAPICGADCGLVPTIGQTFLLSKVITEETVKGLIVPSAALLSGDNGSVSVVGRNGKRYGVTVVASARGMSIIEGVSTGVSVRIPAAGK